MTATIPSAPQNPTEPARGDAVDMSCRYPVAFLFFKAAVWLVIGSALGLLASVKLHAPNLLANCPWLTYGRLSAAVSEIFLYGFASQVALGIALWLMARLGNVPLMQPFSLMLGYFLWNTGVFIGVIGILAGDASGYDFLQMPRYAAPFLFSGYALIVIAAFVTFHLRRAAKLHVSQWFLFAGLFWFPWIYSTAVYVLLYHPPHGVMQVIVDFWYANNFSAIWLGSVALAVIFYFIPKIAGRDFVSRNLAALGFWVWLFFAGWCGIPRSSPLPAWVSGLSLVAGVFMLVALTAILIVWKGTLGGACSRAKGTVPTAFASFGAMAFIATTLLNVAVPPYRVGGVLNYTLAVNAFSQIALYGFVTMTFFGAIYYIVPRIVDADWARAAWPKTHLYLAMAGFGIFVLSMFFGGFIEGTKIVEPNVAFADVWKSMMPFLGMSTLGILLMLAGHVALAVNLGLMIKRHCCCCSCSTQCETTEVAS
jgi:cytochrome c oxidase cbb3-type subunit 1